jgi:N-acetylmuramoyl-L-alanine amidase
VPQIRIFPNTIIASLLLLLCARTQVSATNGLQVHYPNPASQIEASSTFIVGAIEPGHTLTCNGTHVQTNDLGFFAHVVPLAPGVNNFALSVDNGLSVMTLKLKRELPRVPISPNEMKIASFQPAHDMGVKVNDLISFSLHATPLSQVSVQIGSHRIILKESQSKAASANRKRGRSRRSARIAHGQDVAYGEVFQRASSNVSDLYTGFYRVTLEDNWQGVHPQVYLQHQSKVLTSTPNTRLWTVSQPAIAQTTHPLTVVRLGPGLARTTPLEEGVRLEIDGWVGTQMRCRYGGTLHVWIDKSDLAFETDLPNESARSSQSAPPPQAVVRTINIRNDDYGQSVQIPLSQRLPYQVEQKLSPNMLCLKVYGATADTDWITNPNEASQTSSDAQEPDSNPIDHLSWKQVSDDVYEVTVYLRGHRQWGYITRYDGTTLCLGVKKPIAKTGANQCLSGIKICLDPGHGGSETGSIGCSGIHESAINLAIALKLQALLQAEGALVTMTRMSDSENRSLAERVATAVDHKVDLLLSIHNNALPDGHDPWKEHGTSSYWYHPQSIELSRALKDSLVRNLKFPDLGARYQNLALARPTAIPAVLVEVGFMINPDEYAKLIDPGFQEQIAEALRDGLINYCRGDKN